MIRIVILGGGVGGTITANLLVRKLRRRIARDEVRVTVVDQTGTHTYQPGFMYIAMGGETAANLVRPERTLLDDRIELVVDEVVGIDERDRRVLLATGGPLAYDFLVIATGPKLAFEEIEGLGPEGHTQSICHVDHAVKAEKAWQEFVKDPGPIVVGAVQLASCFGPAYEYAAIMDTDLRRRKIRDKVPMTFVTAEPYIGHLGLGGVGDSKGMLESIFRERHIRWICNAKTTKVEAGKMYVTEHNDDGTPKKEHVLDFKYSMMLPAFKGVDAVFGIEGLANPRGFIVVDPHQRNPKFKNIYSVGVCIAIAPPEPTPVPTGVPKTGYMIESMVTATVHNIRAELDGKEPAEKATWNAVCLADFGDTGVAFVALPQIPPRNVNWFSEGKWVHLAKIAFEKYFMRKMKKGSSEPVFEKMVMGALGIMKIKR